MVDKLVKQIAKGEVDRTKATRHRPGDVTLPADIPGEVVASRPETYAPHIGWHRAVCVDVHDLGVVETKFGPRPQVEFAFELESEQRRDDGRRQVVWRKFNPSLADNSNLRKFLEVWQGYAFAAHELKAGVPLASRFYHRDGLVLLEPHTTEEGKTYRNIVAAYPLPAKAPRVKSEGTYIRKVWRRKKQEEGELHDGTGAIVGDAVEASGVGSDPPRLDAGADGPRDRDGDGVAGGHGAAEAGGVGAAGDGGEGGVEARVPVRKARLRVGRGDVG